MNEESIRHTRLFASIKNLSSIARRRGKITGNFPEFRLSARERDGYAEIVLRLPHDTGQNVAGSQHV